MSLSREHLSSCTYVFVGGVEIVIVIIVVARRRRKAEKEEDERGKEGSEKEDTPFIQVNKKFILLPPGCTSNISTYL